MKYFLAALGLSLLISCGQPLSSKTFYAVKVIDGDTLILNDGEHLRLIGIDTPEVRIRQGHSFVFSPKPFALEAKRFVKNLVEGKKIYVEFGKEKTDKYGRALGYCFLSSNNLFVNKEVLKRGLAIISIIPPNDKYLPEFISAQKFAQKQKNGLWQGVGVISPEQAAGHLNEIIKVKGRARSVFSTKGGGVVIKFVQPGFKVYIPPGCLDYFFNKGITPFSAYKNKILEVIGRVRQYKGVPEIIIPVPQLIKVYENQD